MPGLLTLHTDLKSLKYGNDTPGGGDSGQPYIKTDINTVDKGINKLRFTRFDDGLIRGGIIGTVGASVVDTLRIGKFLTDFPKGPLFIVKQIGLQLSNPKLEHKILPTGNKGTNNPTSGQGFFNNVGNFFTNVGTDIGAAIKNTANKIENEVGPTRIYNLGINTLAQVPVNALGGHIVRHGFLPNNDESKYYFNVVRDNNFVNGTNRLINLSQRLIGNSEDIDSYAGGPNSVYGIGSTTIRRRGNYIWLNQDITANAFATTGSFNFSKDHAGNTRNENGDIDAVKIKNTIDFAISNFTSSSLSKNSFDLSSPKLDNSFIYKNSSDSDKNDHPFFLRNDLPDLKNENDTVLGKGPSSYPGTDSNSNDNKDGILNVPALVYNYANPALKKYSEVKQQVDRKNIIKQNNFTTKPIFNNRDSKTYKYNTGAKVAFNRVNDRQLKKDEIKVIFTPIQPFTAAEKQIQFLSYITGYSEDYTSDWGDVKYVGRAESFYIFKGFKKTVSLGLNIPCFNSKELTSNHAKLLKLGGKSLAYALAGQYNEKSLLGGVLIKLTVGNYLVNCPGIITSLKFDIVEGSSWDLDKKYAHILKIDIGFTVIGNELPVYESSTFDELPKEKPVVEDKPVIEDTPVDSTKDIPIATSDYLGSGAGFERAGGNTDAQRAFMEKQMDKKFGF